MAYINGNEILFSPVVNIVEGGGIIPTGTIDITENGTYNVSEVATANVNVASGASDNGWWDIKTILAEDTRDYKYKAILLFRANDIEEETIFSNGEAFATSDGAFYEIGYSLHTWDLTKDKPCIVDGVELYKTRYVITYSNSEDFKLNISSWISNRIICVAGQFCGSNGNSGGLGSNPSLQSILELDTSNGTNFNTFFSNYTLLSKIPELDTSNGTNFSNMFNNCYSLQSIPELDTSNGTNFESMFNGCKSLVHIPELDTSNGTNFNTFFASCTLLPKIPELDTSNGTSFIGMFRYCSSLRSIPELDISNGTNYQEMFNNCKSLVHIPELDTSNSTSFNRMFSECSSLRSIPELDTSNGTSFVNMFNGCKSLVHIPKLNLIKATSVDGIFNYCSELTTLNLLNIKLSLKIGSGTQYGHLLTIDSLINTIQQLWDYSSGSTTYTLTMGYNNTEKIKNTYVRLITPTAEQIANDPNIESKMPCEVCESTDEGAMTITEYANLKMWVFA